jgi:hypothetical protein
MTLSLLSNSVGVLAQQQQTKTPSKAEQMRRVEVIEQERVMVSNDPAEGIVEGPVRERSDRTFEFLSLEMSFNGKVVKGAPYSAEAVTEIVQVLGDGNRIVKKTSASVYRDGDGRTRRDQTLGSIGPFAAAGDPPQTFFINDPVAGVNYVLDPRSRTARKLSLTTVGGGPGEGATVIGLPPRKRVKVRDRDDDFVVAVPAPPPHGSAGVHVSAPPPPPLPGGIGQTFHYSSKSENVQKESLGERQIEGVRAEGTRSTLTIPAGEIGNEQPINVVSERWYSPELQVVVMTKHTDPRFGETTYRLTNINRSEPARTLFEVPSDYTVKEGPAVRTFMRTLPKPKEKEEK